MRRLQLKEKNQNYKRRINKVKVMEMEYELFIKKIGNFIGLDLKNYKRHQLERRIKSLMRAQGIESYAEYYLFLKKDDLQLKKLLDHLTINVSEFYRNPTQWRVLEEKIFPELLKKNYHLTIWSAGCATGEEPYTIALILKEKRISSKIYATDIDKAALNKAKEGFYNSRAVVNVPANQLDKYFVKEEDGYRIKREIKNLVTFQCQDMLSNPFKKKFDLILCRNVVIYFTEEAKDNLYKNFYNALVTGGVLFTGSTEQIFQASALGLEAVASFFYKKISI